MFKKPSFSRLLFVGLGGLVALGASAGAVEFAPEGARGTLELFIKVEGEGHADECSFCDHYTWSVLNEATLSATLTAAEPTLDVSKLAALGGDEADELEEGEDDEDWEAEWDDKLDACDGDESCEVRVTLQKMKDPRFQGAMGAVRQGMEMMEAGMLDLDPSIQPWTLPGGGVSGKARIEQKRSSYGVADTGDGSLVDVHCRVHGEEEIVARTSGYGDVSPILSINVRDSTYELRLPADETIAVTDDCSANRRSTARVLGTPAGGKTWTDLLTVQGKLGGSARRPSFEGSKVLVADHPVDGAGAHPLRVTVSWKFRSVTD